jgi:hypothetical protein
MDTVPRVSKFYDYESYDRTSELRNESYYLSKHFFLFSRLRLQTFTKTPSAPHVILRESHTKKW